MTTQEGNIEKIKILENSFLQELRSKGFDIADDAVCSIKKSYIKLGISASEVYSEKGWKMAFASEVTLYAVNKEDNFRKRENEINFGTTGCFSPDVKVSYWRTIHAATVLKNWELACSIINDYCKEYCDLEKELNKQK